MTRPASNGSIIGATQEPTPTSAGGIWTLPAQLELQKQGKWIAPGYNISRSLRFNSADSAYLSRTPASAGNRRTFTFSCWVKRSALIGDTQTILNSKDDATAAANTFAIRFTSAEALIISNYASGYILNLTTTQVFRDISAWGHLVVAIDTTQATSSNRVKIYWNGVQITAFGTATYPSQNTDLNWNVSSQDINIGRYGVGAGGSNYFNGYLTEFYLIDGQALDPSYFGVVDNLTGVWRPKQVENMNYGTNGFYLPFSDNTSTTTLGYDQSGNANNWTLSAGFSVAAGANNDSLVDTPTPYGTDTGAGGEVRGNYCTLNPLNNTTTLSDGNLQSVSTADDWYPTVATFGMSSGKWYWEIVMTAQTAYIMIGIVPPTFRAAVSTYPGILTGTGIGYFNDNGDLYTNGNSNRVSYGAGYTVNDVIGVALDMDAGTLTFYKNGVSQGTAATGLTGTYLPAFGNYRVTAVANFGQRPFAYTPPSGFKALCTTNLPEPTVVQGDDHFNTVLYTGTGASQSITGVGFQPDFVWIKNRVAAYVHVLFDVVRGSSSGYFNKLVTSSTGSESLYAQGAFGAVTALNSDGFTVDSSNSDWNQTNASGTTYVAWNWKANGAGVSNTAGTITSTVSANTTAGISIVTYTGNSASDQTVGHGLGVTPGLIIVKSRGSTAEWVTYHSPLGPNKFLYLNQTTGESTVAGYWGTPSSTTFGIKGGGWANNVNGVAMVAYCFAEVEGFSKFGSYTGNGSADGPFVYTGFRPAFVLIKRSNDIADWFILDAVRNTINPVNSILVPNTSSAEATNAAYAIDYLSNGFKLRNTATSFNGNASTFTFAAFAENPFKNALAR